jgi:hypothetical protein
MIRVLILPLLLAGSTLMPADLIPLREATDPDDVVLAAPIGADFFCIDCYECSGQSGHSTNGSLGDFGGGFHNETCNSGTCDTIHGMCCCNEEDSDFDMAAALDDVAALQEVLMAGDADGLAYLVNRGSEVIRVEAERSAIQVVNCSGDVVAHFPLSAEMFTAVAPQP